MKVYIIYNFNFIYQIIIVIEIEKKYERKTLK